MMRVIRPRLLSVLRRSQLHSTLTESTALYMKVASCTQKVDLVLGIMNNCSVSFVACVLQES